MDHAILVAAGTGIEGENLSACGETEFGSLPQIKRLVITAQRAGIRFFTIITDRTDTPLKGLLAGDKRIDSSISWHTLGTGITLGDDPSLIIQSNLITTPKALSNFMEEEPAPGEISVLGGRIEGRVDKNERRRRSPTSTPAAGARWARSWPRASCWRSPSWTPCP
ncbi:MAG: hypothetical protein R3B51_08680 [Thermodesulfobacteriota bacterium]